MVLDLNTPILLQPGTMVTVQPDRTVTVHHPSTPYALRVPMDIVLLLYALSQPTSIEAICADWPVEDHAKIVQHLQTMAEYQIVIPAAAAQAISSVMTSDQGQGIVIGVDQHVLMLEDTVRLKAYQRAIANRVTASDVVLDLGAGTGILSFFAAQQGAQQVYAVERRPDVAALAEKLAEANGFSQVTVIPKASQTLSLADFPQRPTVLVSEILGDGLFEEQVFEFMLDARDRLLSAGGKIIPAQIDLMAVGFHDAAGGQSSERMTDLTERWQIDFSWLERVVTRRVRQRIERMDPNTWQPLTEPVRLHRFDLQTMQHPHFQSQALLPVLQSGNMNALCLYFVAWLDDETLLSNDPLGERTHWHQWVITQPTSVSVRAGQSLTVQSQYDGRFQVSW